MECINCGRIDVKIHAKGLCRKCYDAKPEMVAKRKQWKEENIYSRLKNEDILKLIMR